MWVWQKEVDSNGEGWGTERGPVAGVVRGRGKKLRVKETKFLSWEEREMHKDREGETGRRKKKVTEDAVQELEWNTG